MTKAHEFKTMVEALRFRAKNQPHDTLFTFLRDGLENQDKFTFEALDARARQIAGALRKHVDPGSRVLVNHSPGLEYVASLYGCFYAGVVAVPVYPPRFDTKLDRLVSIAKSAQAKAALTSTSIYERLKPVVDVTPELSGLVWLETDHLATEAVVADFGCPDPDAIALLQYTSGSTSEPKGVVLSHANLVANVKCICANFKTTPDTRSIVWLPPYHDMGLVGGLLPPVWIGFPMVLMSPFAFVQKPLRWLKAISKYKVTVSGGPTFAFELCTQRIRDDQMEGLDLSSWNVAFCGAEPIRNSVLDAFAERFQKWGFKKEALYPCYGLAEATLMVTGGKITEVPILHTLDPEQLEIHGVVSSPSAENDMKSRTLVGCGVPVADHHVVIADAETHAELPDGRVGEIWVSGPSVAQGYWDKPEMSGAFKARLSGISDERRFLQTGDLGFLRNGELYVTGRKKDLLIVRGRNFYPQDIEFTASQTHAALGPAAAFSVVQNEQERLVVLQEVDRTVTDEELDGLIDTIRRNVLEEHGLVPYAVSMVKRHHLPVTSSGKIQRFLCRKLFLEGQLKERKRFLEV